MHLEALIYPLILFGVLGAIVPIMLANADSVGADVLNP